MDAPSQQAVIGFLADPASHGGKPVERIDTHISTLFLVGERVFKLKKAVRLSFLDFSTLAARHAACDAEVTINRRTAPDLYLGLVAITREADGMLAFDGSGTVEEWVVAMRRFDQSTLFDRLSDAGRLDTDLIDGLTDAVAACHAAAPIRSDKGGRDGIARVVDSNRAALLAASPVILDEAEIEALDSATRAALNRLSPLLEARRESGLVRACHGDLHLGNICLVDGRPTLFDAIEFSDDYSCIDLLYDLAFLLMDLDHRGRRDLACRVMNRTLDRTGDYDGIAALPLFLSLRAAVRALVLATAASAAPAERERQGAEARRYLTAARAYLIPPPPRLLAVGGLSGSGKSRLGRDLAPLLGVPGAVVVRSDAIRKQLQGVPPDHRLGPDGYDAAVTDRTYQTMIETCARLLAAGLPVIADAVFARPEQRVAIEAVAKAAALPFAGFWLEVAPEIAAARIVARRPDVSDATPDVLLRQLTYPTGPIDWTRIDSGQDKPATLAAARASLGL
jgi:aminoglycoside phosphotransferase family enzyme/predicted kinase